MAIKMVHRICWGTVLMVTTLGSVAGAQAQESSNVIESRLNAIWNRLINDDREPPKGTRGEMCAIAPTNPEARTTTIWHDQPVIVWQSGTVGKLSLQDPLTQETLWEHIPSAEETHVVYNGAPLQAGETYTLALHKFASGGPTFEPEFQVMSSASRTLISNGLKNSLEANEFSVSDAEWTAIHQADYFSKRDLSFDAIQALFSVENPSAELLAMQAQVIETACN